MRKKLWIIYLLHDPNGTPCYVGKTHDLKRRLKEHRKDLRSFITVKVLETGCGDWQKAETKWIRHYRRSFKMLNIANGGNGPGQHSQATRDKLSKAFLGRAVTWGDKIGDAQRGVPKQWTKKGKRNCFKGALKGHRTQWDGLTKEQRSEKVRLKLAGYWSKFSREERSRMATERNKLAWEKRTPKERRSIGQKIQKVNAARGPEWRRGVAKLGAKATHAKPGFKQLVSKTITNWWKALRKDPVAYRRFIDRRAREIHKAKRLKAHG